MLTPPLRLKVDAHLAAGAPLYVLTLEHLSIVAALRELSWQLATACSDSFLDEQEYAATVVETLCPMALNVRLVPPGSDWDSHATLRLHTEIRAIDSDTEESEDVVQVAFRVHHLVIPGETLERSPAHVGAMLFLGPVL